MRSSSFVGAASLWSANHCLSYSMHTSPWSTGVTRCRGSSWYVAGTDDSSGDLYGTKIAGRQRARQERVVDAEERVAEWRALGEDDLVERGAGVAGGEQLDLDAGLPGERGEDLLRDLERVVGDQRDGRVPGGRRGRSSRRRGRSGRRGGGRTGGDEGPGGGQGRGRHRDGDGHEGSAGAGHGQNSSASGWMASRTPESSVTVAVVSTKTLLTPRVEPGSRRSPSSG